MRIVPSLVTARAGVRKMRGVTQAHLVRADDDLCYVVKFTNNPVGLRVLANELICSLLLGELGIATPQPAIVRVDKDFVEDNPHVLVTDGGQGHPVAAGLHFGSWHPGETTSIFDFLPDAMLSRVVNRDHFVGVLLFDLWISNAARQAVFYRVRSSGGLVTTGSDAAWIAQMIDHDQAFGGYPWGLRRVSFQGPYRRRMVYGRNFSRGDFAPWTARLLDLPDNVFDQVIESVPAEWICGAELEAHELMSQLRDRRRNLHNILSEAIQVISAVSTNRAPVGC